MMRPVQKDGVGPPGFKLTRKSNSSSYDPMDGIEWDPARESDELYEALKKAFPTRKTHRERMCEALMQFLAEELGSGSTDRLSGPKPNQKAGIAEMKALEASKKPLFRSPAPKDSAFVSPSKPEKTSQSVATPKEIAKRSGKDWEEMTVVWKSNVGLTKGARPRRMMTEEERTDYRMRRVRGACVACKRKKRKCNHDPDPSPSSSSDTLASLPPTPPLRAQPTEPNIEKPSGQTARKAPGTTLLRSAMAPQKNQKSICYEGNQSYQFVDPTSSHIDDYGDSHFEKAIPQLELQSHIPLTASLGAHSYWDPELLCFDSQGPHINATAAYVMSTDVLDGFAVDDEWNSGGFSLCNNNLLSMAYPDFSSSMPEPFATISPSAWPQYDTTLKSPSNGQNHHNMSLDSQMRQPGPEMLENHWEQAHAQAHVEEWLNQKVNEEQSAARDPELELHQEGNDGLCDDVPVSAQKRRVKFDFSSLIDGPPTLSAPPAEGVHEGRPDTRSGVRPPRSTSRHSTASRMSFSDIISLSSALTTLSMKDGESRRGSVYSAGSERIPLFDNNGDKEEAENGKQFDGDHLTDNSGDSSKTTEGDEDDVESVDWADFNMKENQAMLSRDELFERYIRIDTPPT